MTRISALYPSFVGFENLFNELEKFIANNKNLLSKFVFNSMAKAAETEKKE